MWDETTFLQHDWWLWSCIVLLTFFLTFIQKKVVLKKVRLVLIMYQREMCIYSAYLYANIQSFQTLENTLHISSTFSMELTWEAPFSTTYLFFNTHKEIACRHYLHPPDTPKYSSKR